MMLLTRFPLTLVVFFHFLSRLRFFSVFFSVLDRSTVLKPITPLEREKNVESWVEFVNFCLETTPFFFLLVSLKKLLDGQINLYEIYGSLSSTHQIQFCATFIGVANLNNSQEKCKCFFKRRDALSHRFALLSYQLFARFQFVSLFQV